MKAKCWKYLLLLVMILGPVKPSFSADKGSPSPLKLVAYYFHPTQQCVTCRTIQAYAKEAIEGKYGDLLKAGVIEWRPLNVEQRPYNHFIQDYQLVTSSLVLVKFNNGKKDKWRTLDKAWTLVRKKGEFIQYVQSNVAMLLGD